MSIHIPEISVITIVKNNEKLLPRAIFSVLNQIFTDFEYIIINDGSTDRTKAIIDDYTAKDNRIKAIHIPHNVGRAMARNKGLDAATGRYIFFIDSDDYLPTTALNDLHKIGKKYNSDIVYGRIKPFDQKTGKWCELHYTDDIINHERHDFRLDEHLVLLNNHHIVGRLFRRNLIKKNKIYFSEKRKNGEDVLFAFYTAFYAERLSMVPKITAYFYCIGNYFSKANEEKLIDARDNVLETIEFVKKKCANRELLKAVIVKGAMFAGDLSRAEIVFAGSERKFKEYLPTLVPLIEGITDDLKKSLPLYYQRFTDALLSRDFTEAYLAWTQRNISTTKNFPEKVQHTASTEKSFALQPDISNKRIKELESELENLRNINLKIAHQLNKIYNSKSWRITGLFRRIARILREKKHPPAFHGTKFEPPPVVLKPGIDLSLDLTKRGFGNHRSGWKFAVNSLKSLHNPEGLYMLSYLEKIFLWDPKPVSFDKPWIGISHRPHNIPDWFPLDMRRLFYQSEFFPAVLPDCRGIFTLSQYHAKHLSQKLSVPVETLVHPTEIPERQWNPEVLSETKIKVVQVGWWLRNLHAIFMLPLGDYEKIYLTKRKLEPVDKIFSIEAEYLKNLGVFKESMYDTAKTLDFLPNDEYDKLLATSIIFLDLYDASANNAVLESIARAAPILINPLAPVVEYLGKNYPLYYSSYREAVDKLHDKQLLLATHEYLKNCFIREKLSGDYFSKSLQESKIYKSFLSEIGVTNYNH